MHKLLLVRFTLEWWATCSLSGQSAGRPQDSIHIDRPQARLPATPSGRGSLFKANESCGKRDGPLLPACGRSMQTPPRGPPADHPDRPQVATTAVKYLQVKADLHAL